MSEATKKRSERHEKPLQALLTAKPISVEFERSFSAGGSFCTNIQSQMNDNFLSDVYFLFLIKSFCIGLKQVRYLLFGTFIRL